MIGRTAASTTSLGIVIWFNHKGGYGFIKPDDGGPDMFVRSSAGGGFAAGQHVEYTVVTSGEPAKSEAFIRADR